MINTNDHPDRHNEVLPAGKTIAICRCWQSEAFPYCDGSHRKVNAANNDKVGPAIIKAVPADEA